MQIVHEPTGGARSLATNVETADSIGEQLTGLMFRSSIPNDFALVFRFGDPPRLVPDVLTHWRSIHMLFVRVPLDVVWILDGEVIQVKTLAPWWGFGLARADTIVELPAGAADDVAVGDELRIEDGDGPVDTT